MRNSLLCSSRSALLTLTTLSFQCSHALTDLLMLTFPSSVFAAHLLLSAHCEDSSLVTSLLTHLALHVPLLSPSARISLRSHELTTPPFSAVVKRVQARRAPLHFSESLRQVMGRRLVQATAVLGSLLVLYNLWSIVGRVGTIHGNNKRGAGGGEPEVPPPDAFIPWDGTLPPACAAESPSHTPTGHTEVAFTDMNRLIAGMEVVTTLGDLPARYYMERRLSPAELIPLPRVVAGVSLDALAAARNRTRATSSILYCFPDAIIADSTMVGPVSRLGEGEAHPYLLQLNKAWYPDARGVRQMAQKQPTLVRVEGLLVQLTGWTGWSSDHFVL